MYREHPGVGGGGHPGRMAVHPCPRGRRRRHLSSWILPPSPHFSWSSWEYCSLSKPIGLAYRTDPRFLYAWDCIIGMQLLVQWDGLQWCRHGRLLIPWGKILTVHAPYYLLLFYCQMSWHWYKLVGISPILSVFRVLSGIANIATTQKYTCEWQFTFNTVQVLTAFNSKLSHELYLELDQVKQVYLECNVIVPTLGLLLPCKHRLT